jgi:hypothetical protein
MVASVMAAPSPPAKGWMEVYSLVCVEGYGVADAAAKLNLPPAKVRQIRDGVLAWLATNRPIHSTASREEGRRLAEISAREKLEHLYALAMEAWQKSQEDDVVTRQEGILARTTRTVKSTSGKVCYLNVAAKISDHLRAIPLHFLPGWMEAGSDADADIRFELDAGERAARSQTSRQQTADIAAAGFDLEDVEDDDEDDTDELGDEHASASGSAKRTNPPVRDCSVSLLSGAPGTDELLEGFDVMYNEAESSAASVENFRRDSELRARLFRPVQQGSEQSEMDFVQSAIGGDAEASLEVGKRVDLAVPPLLPSGVRRPLTRKERKSRQRLLEKAKKRSSAG